MSPEAVENPNPMPGSAAVMRPREPRPRWYRQVPAATLQLSCSGGMHTVRWRKGRFVLLDHDVASERGLMALGADRPACLVFLDRWRDAVSPGRHPPADRRSFGAELGNIVELAKLVRAERRWADPSLDAGERRAIVDRFMRALRDAMAFSLQASASARGRQQMALRAAPLPSGEEASAEVLIAPGRLEVDLELPLSWVIEVAGRGLDRQDGRLVLAVVDADHSLGALGVSGIVWETSDTGKLTASLQQWWTVRSDDTWVPVSSARAIRVRRPLWWTSSQR